MKTRIVLGAVVAAVVVAVASYGVYQSVHHRAQVSDVRLRDVERLARGESGGGNTKTVCYSRSSNNTGVCNKSENGSGDVCTGARFWETKDCYSHGLPGKGSSFDYMGY